MKKISVDAGCAYIKVVSFDSNRRLIKTAVPAIAVAGKSTSSLDGTSAPSYMCEGQQWSIIETSSHAESTRFPDYPYSSHNAVLMHHALQVAGVNGEELQLATCIPLDDYFANMQGNKDRKKGSVQKIVTSLDHKTLPTISHKVTVPEGLAGWIDMCFNLNGEPLPNMPTGDVGLVDIGGRTTDISVVRGMEIYNETIQTIPRGFLDVLQTLNELLNQKFVDSGQFPVTDLDKALHTKTIEISSGHVENITSEVNQAISIFTEATMRDISRILGNHGQLSGTCFFGAGVYHIEEQIKKLPKVFIPEDPQFCNAIGALKAFYI